MTAPPTAPDIPTVVVVGGGIAGLAAAWELSGGSSPDRRAPAVTVLEASDRLGGRLRTEDVAGRPVDVGPDGFLGRRPEAVELCREVGLGDDLVPIGASGAAVWARGCRRTLPAGLNLGIPTRFLPVARSGILGARGTLRLLVDVLAPRPDVRGPLGDRAIGPLVARKLGARVVDRLVDPVIGGIHAGGVEDMSAAAVFPLLLAVSQRRTGLMRSLRHATSAGRDGGTSAAEPEPAFWTLRGGLGSLTDRLGVQLAARGVTVRSSSQVDLLERRDGPRPGWTLHTGQGPVQADGIVLAVPAGPAAGLLAPHDADAAALLRGIDHASVAVLTLELPETAVPADLVGTGLLVPRGTPLPSGTGDEGSFLVTACSYLSTKWPHLSLPGRVLLRASVGRYGDDRPAALDDDALVARVVAELRVLLGIGAEPTSTHLVRWIDAFPQYRVHHLLRVTGIEAAVKRLPAVAVAGGSYRGVGIPACIASGRVAARTVTDALRNRPGTGDAGPP